MHQFKKAEPVTPQATDSADGGAIVDELLLSSDTAPLEDLPVLSDLSAIGSREPVAARIASQLEELKQPRDLWPAQFQTQLAGVLEARGIDRNQDIELAMAGDGSVIVTNPHTQRDAIEQIFRDHPSLRDQFAERSAHESLVRAAREAIEFQKAYRKDPLQAVQKFSYLFERRQAPHYSMLVTDGQFKTLFDGQELNVDSQITGG